MNQTYSNFDSSKIEPFDSPTVAVLSDLDDSPLK